MKLTDNVRRDKEIRRYYNSQGWKVVVLWECELEGKKVGKVLERLEKTLFNQIPLKCASSMKTP
jgi:G:T-mismatch repair DNA endonuclease (very short patch repair protein)